MSAASQLDALSQWKQANGEYLAVEVARLRALMRRRALWLRRQWSHDTAQDHTAWKISEAQADWLLAGTDRDDAAAFYASDPAAILLGDSIAGLEGRAEEMRRAMRAQGAPAAFDTLAHLFGLTAFERDVLLVALGPELDPPLERLYAYLQDDLTRPYATPHFALELLAVPDAGASSARESFLPEAALRRNRLLRVEEGQQSGPFGGRALRVDERVLNFVLGANQLDDRLAGVMEPAPSALASASSREIAGRVLHRVRSTPQQAPLGAINLVGASESSRRNLARASSDVLGLNLYCLNPQSLPAVSAQRREMLALVEREAVLLQAALYIDLEGLRAEERSQVAQELDHVRALLVIGSSAQWSGERDTLTIPVANPDSREQAELWEQALRAAGFTPNGHVDKLVQQFDFTAAHIARTVASVHEEPFEEALWRACERHAAPKLDELARRIVPVYEWDDIVLPPEPLRQLEEIAAQVANRAQVYGAWGFGAKLNRGRGISALFAGPSGTGKTMAAEVLARHLSLDLYRIDLAGVVSKYIGETEKNLRAVFDAAERGGAILFFDEADALFGKRSEVKDSHDRYANIEVNYLLQRMEDYRGLAILATNRKSALDSAFLRRLRFLVDFPFPDAAHRRRIWETAFPKQAETSGLDFAALARLDLAGGHIRNIALGAAFLAADEGEAIGMPHLLRAARREYGKLDRIVPEAEFGPYAMVMR